MSYCCVRDCKSYWFPASDVIYHGFPKDEERRKKWLSIIPLKGKFYNSARICSLHFKVEDYNPSKPKCLLPYAEPFFTPKSCTCDCRKESCCTEPFSCPATFSSTKSDVSSKSPQEISQCDDILENFKENITNTEKDSSEISKDHKKYKKYDRTLIELALQEYNGTNKTLTEISEKYKISSTILNKYNRHLPKKQNALTYDEEEKIIKYINQYTKKNQSLEIKNLRLLIKQYLDSLGYDIRRFRNNMPGADYTTSFLNRHKDKIRTTITKKIRGSRTALPIEVIDDYFNKLEKLQANPQCNHSVLWRNIESTKMDEKSIESMRNLSNNTGATDYDEINEKSSKIKAKKTDKMQRIKRKKSQIQQNSNACRIKSNETLPLCSTEQLNLRCCVIGCEQMSYKTEHPFDTNTLHQFPENDMMRKMWIDIIGEHNICFNKKPLSICSLHFEDSCATGTTLNKNALPSIDLLVCRMCLSADVKLFCIKEYKLQEAYEFLTGITPYNKEFPNKLCSECMQKLNNFIKLRSKTLQAHSLLTNLVESGRRINMKNITSIDRSSLTSGLKQVIMKPNQSKEYIIENSESHRDRELEENGEIMLEMEKKDIEVHTDSEVNDTHMETECLEANYISDEEVPYKKFKIEEVYIKVETDCNKYYKENEKISETVATDNADKKDQSILFYLLSAKDEAEEKIDISEHNKNITIVKSRCKS